MESELENHGVAPWMRCTACGKRLHFGSRVIAVYDSELGGHPLDGQPRPVTTEDPEAFCSWHCFCTHYHEECSLLRRQRAGVRVP